MILSKCVKLFTRHVPELTYLLVFSLTTYTSTAISGEAITVNTSEEIVSLYRKWTSTDIPEAKPPFALSFHEISYNVSSRVVGGDLQWKSPQSRPNYRLLFFTSKSNPILDLRNLNPSYSAKQLAFYGAELLPYMQYFITVAGIAPSVDEREDFRFWQRAGGEKKDLFSNKEVSLLYVTASIFQEDIEEIGGVVVKFVSKE